MGLSFVVKSVGFSFTRFVTALSEWPPRKPLLSTQSCRSVNARLTEEKRGQALSCGPFPFGLRLAGRFVRPKQTDQRLAIEAFADPA
ncbi:hypothetical protein [Candidatus Methylacidithermus pantelleriae]|uniref:hypothetical protein n=1 Tax=Candidatus Methylacidithermus pantelleriae TaxID=2744239 RepID=UPI001BD66410|nr:hypothetical protein [Candidatus Methylacidithermus pantelleriae]